MKDEERLEMCGEVRFYPHYPKNAVYAIWSHTGAKKGRFDIVGQRNTKYLQTAKEALAEIDRLLCEGEKK